MSNERAARSLDPSADVTELLPSEVSAQPDGATDPLPAVSNAASEAAKAPVPELMVPAPDRPEESGLTLTSAAGAGSDDLEELTLPSLIQAPVPLAIGTTLGPDGRLLVGELLGARGRVNRYAATWRADDGQAVDVELREGPSDHAGLRTESEVLSTVRYAMIPKVYLVHEQEGRRYLALDRVDAETLEQKLRCGLTPEQAISVVLQLAQVIRRLHQAGWALLGMSPADVALGQPLRLIRLGHAERIGELPPQALQVPGYSAPELAYRADSSKSAEITGREDCYSLGAILYHALAGQPLSEGGLDLGDVSTAVRVPGAPQLLAEVLVPADERIDLETFYRRLLALKSRLAAQPLTLDVASATTLGLNPTRVINEDACGYAVWSVAGAAGTTDYALLCVADGMGGMEAGEVASKTAISTVMQGMSRALLLAMDEPAGTADIDARSGGSTGSVAPGDSRLDPRALVRQAAPAVHAAAHGRELGTTITCVVVQDGTLTLAHVGDTRAYLLRAGDLRQLTADHSLVAVMVASGVISAEEAHGHPDSNKVLRSLGSQRELPDGYVDDLTAAFGQPSLPLEPDDWLLICSDGIWGQVEDAEIRIVLMEAFDPATAARRLIDLSLAAGAPDNATAIVARCLLKAALP
jgi:protein phosphatase